MRKRPSWTIPITAWLQQSGLLFLLIGSALALTAAAWQFVRHALASPSAPWIATGAVAWLAFAGIGLVLLRACHRRWGPRGFLLAAVLASAAIQSAAVFSSRPEWTWTNDARIFRTYLDRLAEGGYTPETLGELSNGYDYRVWTRRALPFYLPLRQLAGPAFPRAVQMFQVGLVALALLPTWRTARLLFGRKTAFWATSFQTLMPFRWFAALDFNHHLLGGLYFLAGLWILTEWLLGRPPRRRRVVLAVAASLLLPLMRLEGGIDLVFSACTVLVILTAWTTRLLPARRAAAALLVLAVIPAACATALNAPLARRIGQADLHHHESGPIAFMARGWSPETGGEYAFTYEQIDYLTPPLFKKPVQASILASQAVYNTRPVLFRLLPVKLAKYFLVGYASGAEEMLAANHAARAKTLAAGARPAFLFATMPLVLWGGILLLPRLRSPRWIVIILPCSVLAATYIFLGETSPRYSIYIQPFLFMLAAFPLGLSCTRRRRLLQAAAIPGLRAAGALAILFGSAAALLIIARPALRSRAFLDMRTWQGGPFRSELPATLAPLELQLRPRHDSGQTEWGPVLIPTAPDRAGNLSFYLLSPGLPASVASRTPVVLEFRAGDITLRRTNSLPARISLPYAPGLRGSMALSSSDTVSAPLRIGYANHEFNQTPTE